MSTAMAKKRSSRNDLPSIHDDEPIVDTAVSVVDAVEWITISVPVYQGNGAEFGKAYLPDRVDSGLLTQPERLAFKRLVRGLDAAGERLADGTFCADTRRSALRWLLQAIGETAGKTDNTKRA